MKARVPINTKHPLLYDRYGYSYDELLMDQHDDMSRWERIIKPELFAKVKAYLDRTNTPAPNTEERHLVYRGHDLNAIFFQWPSLSPAFQPVSPAKPATLSTPSTDALADVL